MKKLSIKGRVYYFDIDEIGEIQIGEIVSEEVKKMIREKLVKTGRYQEEVEKEILVKYNTQYLLRKFINFNTVELKMLIEDFKKSKKLTNDDKLLRNMILAELERRGEVV